MANCFLSKNIPNDDSIVFARIYNFFLIPSDFVFILLRNDIPSFRADAIHQFGLNYENYRELLFLKVYILRILCPVFGKKTEPGKKKRPAFECARRV